MSCNTHENPSRCRRNFRAELLQTKERHAQRKWQLWKYFKGHHSIDASLGAFALSVVEKFSLESLGAGGGGYLITRVVRWSAMFTGEEGVGWLCMDVQLEGDVLTQMCVNIHTYCTSTLLPALLVAGIRMNSAGIINSVAPILLCCRLRASLGHAF